MIFVRQPVGAVGWYVGRMLAVLQANAGSKELGTPQHPGLGHALPGSLLAHAQVQSLH